MVADLREMQENQWVSEIWIDKSELIGHTSIEMLAHYHHTNYDDLRRITDRL